MPDISIDAQAGLVDIRLTGEIGVDMLFEVLEQLRLDPAYDPAFPQITELAREARLSGFGIEDARYFKTRMNEIMMPVRGRVRTRNALVCRDALKLPIVWMWIELLGEDFPVRYKAFDTREAAMEWLGEG